jgi:hypothetical protein
VKRIQIALFSILFSIVACHSPETTRTRGGGPGADVGNRRQVINMHEGSRPFYKTPDLIPAKPPPLDAASQADSLSRK